MSEKASFEKLEKRINIVDIGANPINVPPYKCLVDAGLCNIVGFEPHEEAYQSLLSTKQEHERYFQLAVGDGSWVTLNIYKGSGFTSAFPIARLTTDFLGWNNGTRLVDTAKIKTQRLDDINDLPSVDLLKIDIQGGELAVFSNGRSRLRDCICIITEVNFLELYEAGAPSFADIHMELTSQGFVLHKFLETKKVRIPNTRTNKDISNQLLDGDAVYLKDFRVPENLSEWQLKCLRVFSTHVFDSPDLAAFCADELDRRCSNGGA